MLSACSSTPSVMPPVLTPYNPNASITQNTETRTAYQGTWVMVAQLDDQTNRYGVASISVNASSASVLNAGGGVLGWCASSTCATNDETGTVIAGSVKVGSSALLSVGMTPRNSTALRFFMTDADGIVDTVNGKPVIAGQGTWTVNGQDVNAFFAFVQTSSTLSAQALGSVSASSLDAATVQAGRTALSKLTPLTQVDAASRAEAARNALNIK